MSAVLVRESALPTSESGGARLAPAAGSRDPARSVRACEVLHRLPLRSRARGPLAALAIAAVLVAGTPAPARADAAAATRAAEAAIRDKDVDRLRQAIGSLGAEPGKAAAKAILLIAVAGRDLDVHDALLDALVRQAGDAEALDHVVKQAKSHPDWTVRYLVVEALGRIDRPEARAALLEAFSDKHILVAACAMQVSATAKLKEAVPELIARLEQIDKRPKGLEKLGEAAHRALEELTGERFPSGYEWASWWKVNYDSFDPSQAKKSEGKSAHTVIRRLEERGDDQLVKELAEGDIYCVTGDYDHVENVLSHLGLPHTVIQRDTLGEAIKKIPPTAVLVFNCHNHDKNLTDDEAKALNAFVSQGGYLFTSDWELQNIIARAVGGYVAVGNTTDEHEFSIRPGQKALDHPYLRDVFPDNPYQLAAFKWKIDGMSYAVKPVKGVTVLVECAELGQRYGSDIVACTFRHGKGAVLHVLSHFEKQQDPKGDGYALQQLFVNFVVEKQKFRRATKRP